MRDTTILKIAIIVAIVLIIAVAMGWYMYIMFITSAGGQPRLDVVSAEVYEDGTFRIVVFNPGPINAAIRYVEIAGKSLDYTQYGPYYSEIVVKAGTHFTLEGWIFGLTLTPGIIVPGSVILSDGRSFAFGARVKPK